MSRLPTVGGDDNSWGDVLNDFLGVEHNADGTQKTLPLTKGGTGSTTAAGARTNLGAEATSNKGIAGGYAPLDGTGKVPAGNLPAGSGTTDTNAVHKGDIVYNVKDYGAVGNGTTNDRVAIQNAINAAGADSGNAGAIVYFPGGRYKIGDASDATGLVLPVNHPIRYVGTARGRNSAGSLLKPGHANMTMFTQGAAAGDGSNYYEGATLECLYLDASTQSGCTIFYAPQQNFITFRDCTFYGNGTSSTSGDTIGFYAESNTALYPGGDSSWHNIINCHFEMCNRGIKAHSVGITMVGGQFLLPAGGIGVDMIDTCQNHKYIGIKVDGYSGGDIVFNGYAHACEWVGVNIEFNDLGWNLLSNSLAGSKNVIVACGWGGTGGTSKPWSLDAGCTNNSIIGVNYQVNGAAPVNNGTNNLILSQQLAPTVANNATVATLITALKSMGLIQ